MLFFKKAPWVFMGCAWLTLIFTLNAHAKKVDIDQEINTIQKDIAEKPGTSSKWIGPVNINVSNNSAAKMLPDISVMGSMVGAYFKTDPVGDVGHNPARSGFTLQEIELALQSTIDHWFRADVFLGFSEEGVELEEGYVTTLMLPKGLQLRAGKFFLPVGRQNPKHLHNWNFADGMLINEALLGFEGINELGVETSYVFPTPFFLQATGGFSNGNNEASFNGPSRKDFVYNGRLQSSFDMGEHINLLIGASGVWGNNDTGTLSQIYGGDLMLRWKPSSYKSLTWQSEYLYRHKNDPAGSLQDDGFYTYVDYQFARRWHAALRYDQTGFHKDTVDERYRITPALAFNPSEFSRLRLQYEFDKTKNLEANHIVMLQLQFSMGAHGAHPY